MEIQHEIRAAHILNDLIAHVFQRRAVRRAWESAVHIQPCAGGHHALADIQTQRVEHGIKIHRAAQRVRMGGNALLHQIDDELAHHFIAVRAGGDADAADRFAVRGVSAAFDAPSLFDGQGDAGDRRQCLEQNDPLLFGRKALQRGCGMNRQPPVISYLIQRGDGRIRRCTRYRRHRPFLRYDANTNTVFLQVNEAKFHLLRG